MMNSAAKIVNGVSHFLRERVTPVCIKLHLLQIKARVKFKLYVLVFKVITKGELKCRADLIHRHETPRNRGMREDTNDNGQEKSKLSRLEKLRYSAFSR